MRAVEAVVNGILFGSTYSLVAIGVTIIFGVLHRLNVAHGAIIMVAAYAGATTTLLLGRDSYPAMALAFAISVATGVLLGLAVERVAFRPLRNASYLAPFVTTIGVTILLEELFLHISQRVPIFYPEFTPFPSAIEDLGFRIGDLYFRAIYVVIFVVSLALMAGLHLWVSRSKAGLAMRVVEENVTVAELMGIDLRRTEMTAFAVASGLAGAAGCLIGMATGTINPFMGAHLLVVGFVVIVIGGLGNLYGAMIGGLVAGIVEMLATGYGLTTYREAILFGVLFLVLVLKPHGLFGRVAVARD